MFDIGFSELVLIAVLALIVLGPERLPKAARTVGLLIGKVKRSINSMQEELERQVRTEELKEKLKDPYATFIDEDTRAKFDPSFKKEEKPTPPTSSSNDSQKP